MIYNPAQPPQVGMWQAIEATASSLSVQVSAISAIDADNLARVIDSFAGEPDSGLIVLPNPITIANRKPIVERAIVHQSLVV